MNKWISFDCYGTLVDWRTGMQNSLEIVAPNHGSALVALHRRIEGDIEMHEPYRPYREVLAESVRRMAAELHVVLNPGDEQVLAATLPFWPLYSDTNGALVELKKQGWKLAILSNVDRDLIAGTLNHFDIAFDLVITAQDVKSYKPADCHARRFLEISRVAPKDWIYAAVNRQYDLEAGHALGASCVWIDRDHETAEAAQFPLRHVFDMAGLCPIAAQHGPKPATLGV